MAGLSTKINDIDEDEKEKVTIVIAHAGSVDFPCSDEEAGYKFEKYTQELDIIHRNYPDAYIIMSSIPPRMGDSEFTKEANSQIKAFNKRLEGLKEINEKYYFICNWSYLIDKEGVQKDLYKETDPEGIHLAIDGRKALARAWLDEIERLSIMRHENMVRLAEGNKSLQQQL